MKSKFTTNISYLKSFGKEHAFLSLTFILSIYLLLKNSNIPYGILDKCLVIHFLFDAPKSIFLSGCSKLVDIFTTAYTTSLIFYYMVEYIPAQQSKLKAQATLKSQLTSLYSKLCMIAEIFRFSAVKQNIWDQSPTLNEMAFHNTMILCKISSNKEHRDRKYNYMFVEDMQELITQTTDDVKLIIQKAAFHQLDDTDKNNISNLLDFSFFIMMPDRCGTALPSVNYKDLYYELINVKDSIGNLIPDKEIITFSKFTPEEEQRYKTEIEVRRNDLRSQGTSFKKIYIGLDKF